MTFEDPHIILGLARGADRAAVKRAYRQKALQTHPDINPSPGAAEQYEKVYRAAQSILNRSENDSAAQRRSAGPEQEWRTAFDRLTRKSSFPLAFSAACLVGGCVIFAGAVHAHKAIFDGYSYHVLEEAERRKESPSPEQQRINLLLMEKRAQNLLAKRS